MDEEQGDIADMFGREPRPPCQLYLISPPAIDDRFVESLSAALRNDCVAAFQLRIKGIEEHAIARLAPPLQQACAERDVAFIVNDSIALARRLGADGVHLGQGDGDPREARHVLGRDAQIGVTCHNSRHLAMEAGEAGADYVAFGSFYPTGTKDVEYFAEPEILRWWTLISPIPCVAIGGITPENVSPIVAAGADFVAVSAAVWGDPEGPASAVAKFSSLLSEGAGSAGR